MIVWCYPIAFWGVAACLVMRLLQFCLADKGPRWLPLLGVVVACIPVRGIPLGRWVHGVTSGLSVPLLAMMLNAMWPTLFRKPLFSISDLRSMCICGTSFGVALFPWATGLGAFDPYVLGWGSMGLSAMFVIVTSLLLWKENAFGYVLLASAFAWQFGLLESTNAWDYVIDPVYFLVSIVTLPILALRTLTAGTRLERRADSQCMTGTHQRQAA